MIELPLVLLGGLLGSAHCVGMCGGFALTVGLGARNAAANIRRQLVFSCGRVFTYAFLGSVAGFAGFWFVRRTAALVDLQAGLSLLAGGLLVVQGLLALGVIRRRRWAGLGLGPRPPSPCPAGTLTGAFLSSPRWLDVFVAGVLNGLLPCGLVYAYLSLASSTASMPKGMATMLAFGAGTVPVMVLTGTGASVLSYAARRGLFRVAAVCVLLTGMLALGRGIRFLESGESRSPACPACAQSTRGITTPRHRAPAPPLHASSRPGGQAVDAGR
jgi:sulfite exporter TauE/SafE